LKLAGIKQEDIREIDVTGRSIMGNPTSASFVADQPEILRDLAGIDVVFDATGEIEAGAQAAVWTLSQRIPFVTISAELDATLGQVLRRRAREAGTVYELADGDQPGCLLRMIDEITLMGFRIVVAGNCKGFLNRHQTREGVGPWVPPGHDVAKAVSFADGTKQSLELCALANAVGLVPDQRGMHGLTVSKESLVDLLVARISQEGVVDYVLGVQGRDQGGGVFVVARRDGESIARDLKYLRKGDGPYYLFFRDHHLCYLESPRSIAIAGLVGRDRTMRGSRTADVFAVAKQSLRRGEKLGGIGSDHVYGLIDRAEIVRQQRLLPIGLAGSAMLTTDVDRDDVISYEMVTFPRESLTLQLRREENALTA
jgi:predicted homoserine dehydrogenase-like protein